MAGLLRISHVVLARNLLLGKSDLDKAFAAITLDQQQDTSAAGLLRFGDGFGKVSRILDPPLAEPFDDIADLKALGECRATLDHLGDDHATRVGIKAIFLGEGSGQILDREAQLVKALGAAGFLLTFADQADKLGLSQARQA